VRIRKVAVIGAGVMGSGIAQVIAQAGFEVIIRTRRGERGLGRLYGNIEKARRKMELTNEEADSLESNIRWKTLCPKGC